MTALRSLLVTVALFLSAQQVVACTDDSECAPCGTCDLQDNVCKGAPLMGCHTAPPGGASAKLTLVSKTATRKTLLWKWDGMSLADDFGSPPTTTDLTFCIYVNGNPGQPPVPVLLRARIPADGTCGGHACWKTLPYGFGYGNSQRTPDGIRRLGISTLAFDDTRLTLKGSGENLGLPMPLPVFQPLYVQLRAIDGDTIGCWGSFFDLGKVFVNTPTTFKARYSVQ
jgi:hypothetical protein